MKKIMVSILIYLLLALSGWVFAQSIDRFDFKFNSGFRLNTSTVSTGDKLLMESGDNLLLESGDNILLE